MTECVGLLPLTYPQLRIWYIAKLYPDTCVHNLGGLVCIHSIVDMGYLGKSIHAFILRDATLDMRLCLTAGDVQQYLSSSYPTPLRQFDFRFMAEPERAVCDWIQHEFTTQFLLVEQPLYDFALLRINEFIKFHHIVVDGWTIQLMTAQISFAYERFVTGQAQKVSQDNSLVCIEDEHESIKSVANNHLTYEIEIIAMVTVYCVQHRQI